MIHHIRRTPPTKPITPTINRGNSLLLLEVVTTTGELEIAAAIPPAPAGVVGAQGQSVYVVVLSTRVLVTDPDVMVVRTGPFVEVYASTRLKSTKNPTRVKNIEGSFMRATNALIRLVCGWRRA